MQATVSHVENCGFSRWYPLFRRHTIRSIVIELSESTVEYLEADGIVLPTNVEDRQQSRRYVLEEDIDGYDWDEREVDSESDDETKEWELAEVSEIESALETLGGSVFPKLDWSSPQDAKWVACGETLKCNSVSDILFLLKSSDFIAHDLSHSFENCLNAEGRTRPDKFHLVLRQWANLNPSREFRCFVRDRKLLGVSQRDYTNFYEHLVVPGTKERLDSVITSFFRDVIVPTFPDPDFVVDVYIDADDRAFVVDFNPFSSVTDALLFEWNELIDSPESESDESVSSNSNEREECDPLAHDDDVKHSTYEFRIIPSQTAITPSSAMMYRLPKDILDFSLGTAEGIRAFAEHCQNQQEQ